ncbi:hypothetical protein [Gloeothece verrucosa]|uniref:PRTRC system protein B n=1 Tax=Gloeothece verrucosa (strain PCC 7822) TaxID=497965 RepID=E0UMF2_GLOV7|nr:hypothetical protein [Gloeothece verrucosa]ADN18132.1 conserved hypothetical protein [Gloeothece verrucosa PCC 7822]
MLPDFDPESIAHSFPFQAKDWLCSVHIFEGQFAVTYQEDKRTIRKFISPLSVRQALEKIPIDTGFIPPGIVRWGMFNGDQWAVKFIPPQKYTLNFGLVEGKELSLSVPLPAFVFLGKGTTYYLWAVKEKTVLPTAIVFHAPLPNIYDNGAICFGNVSVLRASLQVMDEVWSRFLGSVFNQDFSTNKSKKYPDNVIEQLKMVAGKTTKKYPNNDLVPMAKSLTVAQIIEQFV